MNRISVGTRLIITFVFVAAMTTLVGSVGYFGLEHVGKYLDNANNIYMPSIQHLGTMRYELRNITVAQRTLLSDRLSFEERNRQKENIKSARNAYIEAMQAFEPLPQTEDESEVWRIFKGYLETARAINDEAMSLTSEWEKDFTNSRVEAKLSDLVLIKAAEANRDVNDALLKVISINVKNARNDSEKSNVESSLLETIMLALAICMPLAALCAGIVVGRTISIPLKGSLSFANSIKEGNLDAELSIAGSDEVAALGISLKSMVETLKEQILQANIATEKASVEMKNAQVAASEADKAKRQADCAKAEGMLQAARQLEGVIEVVTSASEELFAQIEQSSRGSDEQSNRMSETASAMEEMNATVMEVAQNASQAADTANIAKQKAENGYHVVDQVVRGIGEVQASAIELKTDMTSLGKQAEEIGQILNVISEIADQTNLGLRR